MTPSKNAKKRNTLHYFGSAHKSFDDYIRMNIDATPITSSLSNFQFISNDIGRCTKNISQCLSCEHFIDNASGMKKKVE